MEIPIFKFALFEKCPPILLPTRAHSNDTGWDVRACENVQLRAGQYALIPLGIKVISPLGWWLEIKPRSSSFAKKQLHALYGTIDEAYEGQLVFACQYLPDINAMGKDLVIEQGEAIGQLIPIRREEMIVEHISLEKFEQLSQERKGTRGTGGFGSTDVK